MPTRKLTPVPFNHVKITDQFWSPKIERNRARDYEKRSELEHVGWAVDEVWQCEIKDIQSLEARLLSFLGSPKAIDIW